MNHEPELLTIGAVAERVGIATSAIASLASSSFATNSTSALDAGTCH